jgi:hypothetical protein
MQLAAQRISLPVVAVAVALAGVTICWVPVGLIPYWLGAIGALTVFAAYVVLGDPLVAVLAWFASMVCLDEEFARWIIPGFFNLTIPRVFLAVLVLAFLAMIALGRFRLHLAWPASGVMALILLCFTVSAAVTGFKTVSVVTVYYRLIGGYWLPFLTFAMLVLAIRSDRDIHRLLVFFFVLSLYLTFTGWAEHFKVWALVWPKYISDPTKGIHWDRVRGPFLASPIMGLALVYCFYNNLVLAGLSRLSLRWACRLTAVLMLPVIFWTQTRSVWLAMALGAIIWIGRSRRGLSRLVGVSLISVLVIVGVSYNWRGIASPRREVGGVTAVEPIYVRLGLVLVTWDMVKDYPLFGVGFGHFRDHAPRYAHNPNSPYYVFSQGALEHNNFLSVLAECGVVGLILYVWVLIALVRASFRLYRRLPLVGGGLISRDLVVLYWILCVDYLADAMFRETTVSPFANTLFFGLSAIIFSLDYLLGPEPLPEPQAERAALPLPALPA